MRSRPRKVTQTHKGNMKATITLTLPRKFDDVANELLAQHRDVSAVDDELIDLLVEDAVELIISGLAEGSGSIEFENN